MTPFSGPNLVYATTIGDQMSDIIEHYHQDRFANCRTRRDLRVGLDASEFEMCSTKPTVEQSQ